MKALQIQEEIIHVQKVIIKLSRRKIASPKEIQKKL